MALFEIHQRFKGHFLNEMHVSFNNTHREKLCFTQFSTIGAGLLLTFFIMFTQPINFYTFHYHVLRVQLFEKCDSSNRQ